MAIPKPKSGQVRFLSFGDLQVFAALLRKGVFWGVMGVVVSIVLVGGYSRQLSDCSPQPSDPEKYLGHSSAYRKKKEALGC